MGETKQLGGVVVIGTAIGVVDRVERAMKSLNISIPDSGVPQGVVGINHAFLSLMYFTPPSQWGSGRIIPIQFSLLLH